MSMRYTETLTQSIDRDEKPNETKTIKNRPTNVARSQLITLINLFQNPLLLDQTASTLARRGFLIVWMDGG